MQTKVTNLHDPQVAVSNRMEQSHISRLSYAIATESYSEVQPGQKKWKWEFFLLNGTELQVYPVTTDKNLIC